MLLLLLYDLKRLISLSWELHLLRWSSRESGLMMFFWATHLTSSRAGWRIICTEQTPGCFASYQTEISSQQKLYAREVQCVSVCVLCSVAPCRILASCTELMQAIKELILSSKDLQRDIVESGRVSYAAVWTKSFLWFLTTMFENQQNLLKTVASFSLIH